MCLHIYLPVIVDNLHGRHKLAPVVLAVQSSAVVKAHEHVNIPEYIKYFRAYTDLGNRDATNVR